jgi:hypothetical protein
LSIIPKSICFLTFYWFRAIALNSPEIVLETYLSFPIPLSQSHFHWSDLAYKPPQWHFHVTLQGAKEPTGSGLLFSFLGLDPGLRDKLVQSHIIAFCK